MHLRIFFVIAVCFFSGLEAYPDGAPLSACDDMFAEHGANPETTPSPFETVTDLSQVAPGGSIGLTLQNITGQSYSFTGFLTMAFDVSKPDDNEPIGTFSELSNGQTLDCFEIPASAITHKNNDSKKKVTVTWTAPSDFQGTVIFKTSWVRGYKNFWVKVPSLPVTVGSVKKINYRIENRA